eukprot:TRINITY_DN11431_c0_g1_i1.p1 TRINITY_DN11431_c0_g1~~TRINITY_DN11431_c0_g1_i1.p1  ORF type:complete len:296 (+),score=57.53 TRINITY_DN11431_c0_g1_i1:110-997(+)
MAAAMTGRNPGKRVTERPLGWRYTGQITNAPPANPPRNLTMQPTSYLRKTGVIVACTGAATDIPRPKAEVRKCWAATPRNAGEARSDDPRVAFGEALLAASSKEKPAIAETCKFDAAERDRLIELRRRLVGCIRAWQDMSSLLAQDSHGGLPDMVQADRVRLNGDTFSKEDATRELCGEWLPDKMRQYLEFVDAALGDKLDPAPAAIMGLAKTSRRPSSTAPEAAFTARESARPPSTAAHHAAEQGAAAGAVAEASRRPTPPAALPRHDGCFRPSTVPSFCPPSAFPGRRLDGLA